MGHYDQGEVKKKCLEKWKVKFILAYSKVHSTTVPLCLEIIIIWKI